MKVARNFFWLLVMTKYEKNKCHPTYRSYLKHAWRLAKEITL